MSLSLSLFRLLCIVLFATRHLSPSRLSVSSFSLTRPGPLFPPHDTPFISSFPRRLRVNPHTNAQESTPLRRRLLPLCVCSSGSDPARLRSLRPIDAGIPLRSPPSMLLRPPLRFHPVARLIPFPSPPSPRTATLQSATTCIHLATKPPRRYSGPNDDKRETVH